MPEVKPIEIAGVPWAIPCIDPPRFTEEQFLNFIRNAMDLRPHQDFQVEFLSLHVACINQQVCEPASAAEVGRQAHISKVAFKVSMWLNDTELRKLPTGLPIPSGHHSPRICREAFQQGEARTSVWSESRGSLSDPKPASCLYATRHFRLGLAHQ